MIPGWPGQLGEPPSMFGQITEESGFLRKSIFCVFGAPKYLFLAPKTLFGLRNLTLKISPGYLQNQINKYDHPKSVVSKAKKGF